MVPIIIQQQQTIKYFRINNQRGERLYRENYKTLLKEILKDTHKWKAIPCSGAVIFNGVKISILPKVRAHTRPVGALVFLVPPHFAVFHSGKIRPKVSMDSQNPQIAKTSLEKSNETGGLGLPGFKSQ